MERTFHGLQEIGERIVPVLEKHGVRRAAIFGSRARGEAHPASDLDILVEFEPERTLLDLVGLRLDLQERFGLQADVVTFDSLRPEFKARVLQEQVQIL
ncbi:MAG: nucleotidyltransferase family protein [Gemmatimonadetes bacterium]|nr:nucleotidyltransferase family protein [Gemmatimonadota bacterium]